MRFRSLSFAKFSQTAVGYNQYVMATYATIFVMFDMHFVTFVIVVVHKYCSWVELLISPYPCILHNILG